MVTTPKEMASENLLKEFSYYFLLFVENTLSKWKKYLDGDPDDVETSIPGNILARMASELPMVGNHLSDAVSAADKWRQDRKESTAAKKMFNIIHFLYNDKEKFRNVLIEAAFDIFYNYQRQFSLVSCEEGPLRAMQKLGMDASQRFLNFVTDSEDIVQLTKDIVTKGVVLGESNRHEKKIFVRGKKLEVIDSGKEVKTKDVLKNVAVRIGYNYIASYTDKKCIQELGYREKFSWEDKSNFKHIYAFNPHQRPSKHSIHINIDEKEEYLKIIRAHITSNDPLDDLKEYMHLEFESLKSISLEGTYQSKEIIVNIAENLSNMHRELDEEKCKSQERIDALMKETEHAKKYCVLRVCARPDHADRHLSASRHHFCLVSIT